MTHHQFGSVAGDKETGGIFELGAAIIVREHTTVAVDSLTTDGDALPIIALELTGRINKSQDTVQAVYALPVMDAGAIAAALYNAAARISDEAVTDFRVGMADEGGN